ncbi:MAG: c-type cytochrome [Thiobacillus sp.]
MMKSGILLALMIATSLLVACGKPEEASAPVPPLPAAEASQAEAAPVTSPESAIPTVETPSMLPPETPMMAPPTAATITKPTEVKPAPVTQSTAVPKSSNEAAPASPKPDLAHGQQIYRQSCAFCHDKGVAGAPKIGDAAAWGPRLAQGMDALYASSLRGKGAMPGKGGNPSLADDDVKAAVDYLSAQVR